MWEAKSDERDKSREEFKMCLNSEKKIRRKKKEFFHKLKLVYA